MVFGNVIASPKRSIRIQLATVNSIEFASGQTYAIAGTGRWSCRKPIPAACVPDPRHKWVASDSSSGQSCE